MLHESQRYFQLRPAQIVIRPLEGPVVALETESSLVIFARLREVAAVGEEVICFAYDGKALESESLAALNCFLRAGRAMGRMLHPWDRLPHAGHDTRYEFSELCRHLDLTFSRAVT